MVSSEPDGTPRTPHAAARGRPAATTRETIEEAAGELFLEQGYESTSVSDIARRAGVSRSSFFNYFDGKADVLWGPVLRALERADAVFDAAASRGAFPASRDVDAVSPPRRGGGSADRRGHPEAQLVAGIVRTTALELAREVDATCIPVAASQAELMGTERALIETGAVLLLERTAWLRARLDRFDPEGDPLTHATLASAAVGGVAAAAVAWMRAGIDRGGLAPFVARALASPPGAGG